MGSEGPKKRRSMRQRKNWRKYISTKDVDDFLDEQRQTERIGSAKLKSNESLFVIDDRPTKDADREPNTPLTKKQRALLPPTCYKILEPLTVVPDPIAKRNRVRSKEERESVILKKFREKRRLACHESQSVVMARQDQERTMKQKKALPKCLTIKKDVWNETKIDLDLGWLGKDALEHNLNQTGRFKIRAPSGLVLGKSVLPALELPHPGSSYNPSFTDHQDLLQRVVDNEVALQKKEAHLDRVTSGCFNKVTQEERQAQWISEMSQGMFKCEGETIVDDVEVKEEKLSSDEEAAGNLRLSINPPSDRLKAKTRKQRRIQKLLREDAFKRKAAKIEKKKLSDLYALKSLNANLDKKGDMEQQMANRKKRLAEAHAGRTKRIGRQGFEEPDIDFSRPCELRGALNLIKKQGNLLADRYFSLQKRNILAPGTKQTRTRTAKVKRFVKRSHKEDAASPDKKRGRHQKCKQKLSKQ